MPFQGWNLRGTEVHPYYYARLLRVLFFIGWFPPSTSIQTNGDISQAFFNIPRGVYSRFRRGHFTLCWHI